MSICGDWCKIAHFIIGCMRTFEFNASGLFTLGHLHKNITFCFNSFLDIAYLLTLYA